MSNQSCATLYTDIIDEVILESRQDFENAGIDEQTLQDLRNIWRQRLLATKVATFPWAGEVDPEIRDDDNGNDDDNEDDDENDNEDDDDIKVKVKDEENDLFETIPTDPLSAGTPVSMTMSKDGANGAMTMEIKQDLKTPSSTPASINPASLSSKVASTTTATNTNDDFESDDDDLGSDLGNDSDAINSDLDDSDDEDENDGDENGDFDGDSGGNDIEQNIMLCLYDRVQRVRNRWKCSLKDGLMNINGKDYVFQKATGDSEW